MDRKKIIILIIGVLIVAGAAAMTFGFLPVINVAGKSISLSQYLKVESALSQFDRVSQKTPSTTADIKKRTMGNLVEQKFLDILIENTDKNLYAKADKLVADTMEQSAAKGVSIKDAAYKIYGLSVKDFTDIILIPQAKRDVLLEYFGNDSAKLQQAWTDIYKNTKVKIYYPGYYWDGEVKTK